MGAAAIHGERQLGRAHTTSLPWGHRAPHPLLELLVVSPSSQHPPSPVTFPVPRTPLRFARRGQSCFPGPLFPPQPIKGRCQRSCARC